MLPRSLLNNFFELVGLVADIVVVDVGVPNIVRGNWLKKGVVVINMGTNQGKVMIFFFSILVVPRCAMM